MDELVGRLVAKIGVDRTAAAGAAGTIAQFPHRDTAQVYALIARIPRADGGAHAAPTDSNSAGVVRGDGIGASSRMAAAGMIQAVVRETIRYARVNAGKNAAGRLVGAIPGSGQWI